VASPHDFAVAASERVGLIYTWRTTRSPEARSKAILLVSVIPSFLCKSR